MDRWLEENLVCPRDKGNLRLKNNTFTCTMGHSYPCVEGIPIILVREETPTHAAFYESTQKGFDRETNSQAPLDIAQGISECLTGQAAVDWYVQKEIAATNGNLYRQSINRLTRYPIPEMRLPQTSGRRFLDIGCNWGRWCINAAQQEYIVVGVDPSLEAIRAARRVARQLNVAATYIVADARHLPFKDNSFDITFSYSVFQHFDENDVRLSLNEIERILKKQGINLAQMANTLGLRNLYNQARRSFRRPRSFEVRYWRTAALRDIFSAIIGPTTLSVDSFFCLNAQMSDLDLLPVKYRLVVLLSEILRRLSKRMPPMSYFADSLYVKSTKN